VTAKIVAPSGRSEAVRFVSGGDEWGVFHGRFTAEEPGQHKVTLRCEQTGATLETSFFVHGAAVERMGKPARPEVLEEIARVTRGRVLDPSKRDELAQWLAELPEPPLEVRRLQLWSHPVSAGVLIFLLGAFWVGRKTIGLI
jgi:hypothetical protein